MILYRQVFTIIDDRHYKKRRLSRRALMRQDKEHREKEPKSMKFSMHRLLSSFLMWYQAHRAYLYRPQDHARKHRGK